ncbi:unnamed protein product [Arctia plantaginis]|uniref:Peptidase M16 N-terminal domain-containing protein n=1 Tax=Arctia plantaginis TaxID=874455 RepID=A0A8S1B7A5_ARCPL|nr:unnamed protein product [Arctia plantaginis]
MNKCAPLMISFRQFSLTRGEWSKCMPKPDYGPVEVQRSRLMNGVKVAAAKPFGAQIGSCTIMYQAGSRYEEDDEIGATHFLRAISAASSQGYSSFAKARYLPQHGASITCTSDRQSISFTLRCPISTFPDLKNYLLDTAVRACYKDWEIDDLKPIIWDDLHRIHPEQRVMDLAQRACWGGPLSNSMFCEYERIDTMVGENLLSFANRNMRTNCCTVASVGVPFEETLKVAEMVESRRDLPPERPCVQSFPRRGYEVYDLGPNSATWIAVVVPGCGTTDIRCLTKHAIVAAACGTGNMAMSNHSMDSTPQTPLGLMSGGDVYTSYKAFNISYNDTGVFGILAKTRPVSAWNVAMAASEFLANVGDLNFKQIEIGKQRLKLGIALNDEDCVKLGEGVALQLANNVQMDNAKDAMALVDSITPDEISCVAKFLAAKKNDMALAVVGDISCVPHDRELIR